MKKIDILHKKFNLLYVISFEGITKAGNKKYLCRCDCGNEKIVIGSDLTSGRTLSCGCLKYGERLDIKNKKFGMLTAIDYAYKKNNAFYWECTCECGNTKIVNAAKLRSGESKSCGCLWKNNIRKEKGIMPAKQIFNSYKRNANKYNRVFELTFEEFLIITSKNCFYCGRAPIASFQPKDSWAPYVYNGIDRVDNSIGYIKSNVVPCCKNCNVAKAQMTQEEFFNLVEMIFKNTLGSRQISAK